MADTKISALAAASAPDQTELVPVIQGGISKQLTMDVLLTARDYWICLSAANTLTSTTALQAAFDSVGAGTLTLPTGVYFFECLLYLSSMSSSNNFKFDIKGAGTATIGSILYHALGLDSSSPTSAGSQTGSLAVTSASADPILTGSNGNKAYASIRGTFRVTAGGTIIPSIALSTSSAADVNIGSYFRCHLIGGVATQSAGPWS